MQTSRFSLALDGAFEPLPTDAAVALYAPRAEEDLSAFPSATVFQRFKPDHDALAARGYACAPDPQGAFQAAAVFLPRSKEYARALIADAIIRTNGGRVFVDGQKTDGIDSLLKECKKRGTIVGALSKAHGKLFELQGDPSAFQDWVALEPSANADGYVTSVGVFSAQGVDRGSKLLADTLTEAVKGRVGDLGAGWGFLSDQVLKRCKVSHLDLIEADHAALNCARQNIDDTRAAFYWADVTQFRPEGRYDTTVCNPPFHTSRKADPELGRAFLRAGAAMLAPSGVMLLVANRHLPYETDLATLFATVEEIGGDSGFKVIRASRPVRNARGRR